MAPAKVWIWRDPALGRTHKAMFPEIATVFRRLETGTRESREGKAAVPRQNKKGEGSDG